MAVIRGVDARKRIFLRKRLIVSRRPEVLADVLPWAAGTPPAIPLLRPVALSGVQDRWLPATS